MAVLARRLLVAALILAALVRVLHLLELSGDPSFFQPKVDAYYYDQAARVIADGDLGFGHEPLRMSPGYFYALGAVYALFGDGPWAPRVLQSLLGVLQVALIWDLARRMLGAGWAWLPAFGAALYGPFLYFEGHLLAASLATFLHILCLWLVIGRMDRGDLRFAPWLGVGLVFGLTAVVRPNALPLVVPLWLACFLAGRETDATGRVRRVAAAMLALALGGALAIAPITLRNVLRTGEPILLTAHGGLNLYVGNGPGAHGTFRLPDEVPSTRDPQSQYRTFHAVAEEALGRPLGAREADAYWVRRTVDTWIDSPAWAWHILTRKLYLYWNGRELENVYDYEFAREYQPVLGAPLVQFVHVAPLALCGSLWMLLRGRPRERVLALYLWAVAGAVVLVFVTDRYRLPVVGPALLCATFALRRLVTWARERRWLALAGSAVVLSAAVLVARPVAVQKSRAQEYHTLGAAWLELGRLDRAEHALATSLAHNPEFVPAHCSLGELYEETGDTERAREHYEVVLRLGKPDGYHVRRAKEGLRRL